MELRKSVIVGCTDGNVYVLWKDGTQHLDGPIARIWTCVQSDGQQVYSTPALCSLDGTHLDLIVGSTDGIYRINFQDITYDPANTARWPWTTFHFNSARTGCTADPSPTPKVSASIIGRVKSAGGMWIEGASITVEWFNGTSWVTPAVEGRPSEIRVNPVYTAGNGTAGDEINEGGFVINQLPRDRSYRLKVMKTGYTTKYVTVPVTVGRTVQDITL